MEHFAKRSFFKEEMNNERSDWLLVIGLVIGD
jgi:hypothetical protein